MKKNTILKGLLAGIALVVIAGGSAMATELYTVNASEDYNNVPKSFVPKFLNGTTSGDCTSALTGDPVTAVSAVSTCKGLGQSAVNAWAAGTGSDESWIPKNDASTNSGYSLGSRFTAFRTGSSNTAQSGSLPNNWLQLLEGNGNHSVTAYTGTATAGERAERVDQILIGFTTSGIGGGFNQNFRTQLTFGIAGEEAIIQGIDAAAAAAALDCTLPGSTTTLGGGLATDCVSYVDQRLEQGDTDMEGLHAIGTAGKPKLGGGVGMLSAQAFQQEFAAMQIAVTSTGFESLHVANTEAEGVMSKDQQNVEQNQEGYFYSCLNCNSGIAQGSFTAPVKLEVNTWIGNDMTNPTMTQINSMADATQTSRTE